MIGTLYWKNPGARSPRRDRTGMGNRIYGQASSATIRGIILNRTPRVIRLPAFFDSRRVLRASSAVLEGAGPAWHEDCENCDRAGDRRHRLCRRQGPYRQALAGISRQARRASEAKEDRLARSGHRQGKAELVLSRRSGNADLRLSLRVVDGA